MFTAEIEELRSRLAAPATPGSDAWPVLLGAEEPPTGMALHCAFLRVLPFMALVAVVAWALARLVRRRAGHAVRTRMSL